MKRLMVVVFAVAFGFSGTAYAGLMNGLVAYYTFEGNPNDMSGDGNDGAQF